MNVVPDLGIKRDVPIVLNSVNYEDSYDAILQQEDPRYIYIKFYGKNIFI